MGDTITIHVTNLDGNTQSFEGLDGYSVMEVIRDNNLPIKAECGGCMCCATCVVEVATDWADKLSAASADEVDLVMDAGLDPSPEVRLSCQIVLTQELDGLHIRLLLHSAP